MDIDAARGAVLGRCSLLGTEQVPLDDALGRVLAENVSSTHGIPPFDNSAMDGYAVRAVDTSDASPDGPVRLRIVDESRAGAPAASPLAPGQTIAISTGAVLPEGADAIIRREDAELHDGSILVTMPLEPGHDVRRAGDDVPGGQQVLARGVPLGPAELGVIASVGRGRVCCSTRPRLAVLTTGDELVGPGGDLGPGQIRDTNFHSVPALGRMAGAAVTAVSHVGDDATATREAIHGMLEADVAAVCGGVSVGEHDHVRPAFAELGVEEVFWGLALRPGKPTWFGTAPDGTLVFGLPGNPVSAVVTFTLLVRPALLALAGTRPDQYRASAVLDEPYQKQPGRAHFVRVRLEAGEDGWHARPTKEQGSHVLTSMLGADAFAIVPSEYGDVRAGERLEIELLLSSGLAVGPV